MTAPPSPALLLAGALSFVAAALHVACIFGGGSWYRALGAGEHMARAAERGHWQPAVVTLGIAAVLTLWGLYAWSGAGLIRPLPLLRWALLAITVVYLVRGFLFLPLQSYFPGNSAAFWYWSSSICAFIGLTHLVGLWQSWSRLGVA